MYSSSKDSGSINGFPFNWPMTTSPVTSTTAQEIPSTDAKLTKLYKTEYCRNWIEMGSCSYGKKCRYAHGDDELRTLPRHSRYKTRICRAYHIDGSCVYGNRCTFIHDFPGLTNTMEQEEENKHLVDSVSSLLDDDKGDNSENPPMVMDYDMATIGSGKLRQQSRFFPSNTVNEKQHLLSLLQNGSPTATTKTSMYRNDGIWDSKLGLGTPQPYTIDCQQSFNPSKLTTIPLDATNEYDVYTTPTLHQTCDPSFFYYPLFYSLPADSCTSSNQSNGYYDMGAYAIPPQPWYQHQPYFDLDTLKPTLDTEITTPLAFQQIDEGRRSSCSSDISSSSSLNANPFLCGILPM